MNEKPSKRSKKRILLLVKLFAKHGRKCKYCSTPLDFLTVTLDHRFPKIYGGKDDFENLVPCCSKCNREKGAMFYKEFKKWIRSGRPEWGKKVRLPYKTHDETAVIDYKRHNP